MYFILQYVVWAHRTNKSNIKHWSLSCWLPKYIESIWNFHLWAIKWIYRRIIKHPTFINMSFGVIHFTKVELWFCSTGEFFCCFRICQEVPHKHKNNHSKIIVWFLLNQNSQTSTYMWFVILLWKRISLITSSGT